MFFKYQLLITNIWLSQILILLIGAGEGGKGVKEEREGEEEGDEDIITF